jgi:hypothetical protein
MSWALSQKSSYRLLFNKFTYLENRSLGLGTRSKFTLLKSIWTCLDNEPILTSVFLSHFVSRIFRLTHKGSDNFSLGLTVRHHHPSM